LYAPSDYKEDKSFLESNRKSSVSNIIVTDDDQEKSGFKI
jgi:hypothetical protein